MSQLTDYVPDIRNLQALLPEELGFHVLRLTQARAQPSGFMLDSLRSHVARRRRHHRHAHLGLRRPRG
jgi:hypothetical protein